MSLLVPTTTGLLGTPQCGRVRDSTCLAIYKTILHLISSSGCPGEGGREADIINFIQWRSKDLKRLSDCLRSQRQWLN